MCIFEAAFEGSQEKKDIWEEEGEPDRRRKGIPKFMALKIVVWE
jgi:hypothetical protein